METKKCNQCNETKDLDQFSKLSKASDGKQPQCKACNKVNNAKFRKKRPKYMNEYYGTDNGKRAINRALDTWRHSYGSGLYTITNTVTGRYYIGSSTELRRRSMEWKTYLESPDKHKTFMPEDIYSDIMKYGKEVFSWEITATFEDLSASELMDKEYHLISFSHNVLNKDLYNTLGTSKNNKNIKKYGWDN